jgi:hypothetical protein
LYTVIPFSFSPLLRSSFRCISVQVIGAHGFPPLDLAKGVGVPVSK